MDVAFRARERHQAASWRAGILNPSFRIKPRPGVLSRTRIREGEEIVIGREGEVQASHLLLGGQLQPVGRDVPRSGFRFSSFGFRVSGFGFQVSGFGFRVSGLGFRVSGFGFTVQGLGCRVQGLGFRNESLRFRVSGGVFQG